MVPDGNNTGCRWGFSDHPMSASYPPACCSPHTPDDSFAALAGGWSAVAFPRESYISSYRLKIPDLIPLLRARGKPLRKLRHDLAWVLKTRYQPVWDRVPYPQTKTTVPLTQEYVPWSGRRIVEGLIRWPRQSPTSVGRGRPRSWVSLAAPATIERRRKP